MPVSVRCPVCGESTSVSSAEQLGRLTCRCGVDLEPSSSSDSEAPSGVAPGSSAPAGASSSGVGRVPSRRRKLAAPDLPPEKVGRFEIGKKLGEGAFGSVYLARDPNLDRNVALKVAHPQIAHDPDLLERFKKEARAAARMKHPGIVIVHEVDTDGTWFYIATEHLDGQTLRELLREGRLPPRRAAEIAADLARALAHAHIAGVTHRDVKPSNVMITRDGEVKLIDFGLARLDASTQTGEVSLLGTIVYMSPEQARGGSAQAVPKSDQYSLGVVLYEMLCGRPPYRGAGAEVLSAITSPRPVPRPSEFAADVPPGLESICLVALSKDPDRRYDGCRLMADELARWLADDEAALVAPRGLTVAAEGESEGEPDAPPESVVVAPPPHDDEAEAEALDRRNPLQDLVRLAAERATREDRAERARNARLSAARNDMEERQRAGKARFDAARAEAREAEERRQRLVADKITQKLGEIEAHFRTLSDHIRVQAARYIDEQEKKAEWTIAMAAGFHEKHVKEARVSARKRAAAYKALRRKVEAMNERVAALARRNRAPIVPTPPPPIDALVKVSEVRTALDELEARLAALEALRPPDLLERRVELVLDALVFGVTSACVAVILQRSLALPLAIVAGAAAGAAAALFFDRVALRALARREAAQQPADYEPLCRDLAALESRLVVTSVGLPGRLRIFLRKVKKRHDKTVGKAAWKRDQLVLGASKWREGRLKLAAERLRASREELQKQNPYDVPSKRIAELEQNFRLDQAAYVKHHRETVEQIEIEHQAETRRIAAKWADGLCAVEASIASLRRGVDRVNPPWHAPGWADAWSPPVDVPAVVRFGEIRVGLDKVPRGLPRDPKMHDGLPREFAWPALLSFPDRAGLVVEAPAAARAAAVNMLQAVAMRFLTALPPGRVRLSIIDPKGLGADFGAFLHLADFEAVPPVITESAKIEQCLADHLDHIKRIISYLRNDHESISEFNEQARETAEPFRVLIVSDFPEGFGVETRAQLASIARSGARCGVLVLAVAASDLPPTVGAGAEALAANAVRVVYKDGAFSWDDPDFRPFPITPDVPPPADAATRVLRRVGAAALDRRRVVVPFEFAAPDPARWWTGSTSHGIEIGIGKAAPSKVHCLSLGKGSTAHHVLIAGRTGSGKSTLMHALVTNLALTYGPDEVEFYLIDFKKGVEFKTYATHELPHARVIAVESEREFGLSVLKRLDEELTTRGVQFREAGVQDLAGYRSIEGLPPMPRALLVVDEFQEFFTEDDQLAAEAAGLLDRLVRQGRSFGVHVLLGSQSLGGAFTMSRSTLGQMGVRIALQCGEADAHLILGEDNGAARLLSRPGEAIYNDKNGLPDANQLFQIIWLDDHRREDYLRRLRDAARDRRWEPPTPTVVFEGNAPALVARNRALAARLAGGEWPDPPRSVLAWIGEPIAIKDPTAASFGRLAGDNLLILGQAPAVAAGLVASTILSVAAQLPSAGPGSARFEVLDGAPEGSPGHGQLGRVCAALPHAAAFADRRSCAATLARIAAEVDRRLEVDDPDAPSVFLVIFNLAWFRDVRREDYFDYSDRRDAVRPAADLAKIVRNGPTVGVYVVMWCDTLNNLNAALERGAQHEFCTKVALQMSANDSSHFLDSPAAGRLGPHRAMFVAQNHSANEKFRPYGAPPAEWLGWVQERLALRAEALADDGGPEPEPQPPGES